MDTQSTKNVDPTAAVKHPLAPQRSAARHEPIESRPAPFGGRLAAPVEDGANADAVMPADENFQHQLAVVRLGIAGSLFTALDCKHAPTAAHSLRVALACSHWALALQLDEEEISLIEVAALLHDVGKVAFPDAILLKPGHLAPGELALMDGYRRAGLRILRTCCASQGILDIVRNLPAWYDGSRPNYPVSGREIPFGARMLAIVDAFDSMTTEQVYRPAMSREAATAELFAYAGTQFDPDLVELFAELEYTDDLDGRVAARWLEKLKTPDTGALWRLQSLYDEEPKDSTAVLFQEKLLDNMHDAVVFVDRNCKVLLWNRGAERLTGIASVATYQQPWVPGLIGLHDEHGRELGNEACPVHYAIQTGVQSLRRLMIRGRQNRLVAVDLHTVPVVSSDGSTHGATLLLHDASPEASLEQRCQSLHERATKDPLTQVANRAEFDRTHKLFVAAHLERQLPCSLIICDIDRFKHINDTYGHPAGDEAIKSFAQLLKGGCRPGDLVARYGGEEFVVLCADCRNSVAAGRAEQMRKNLARLPQAALGGLPITASFGVTEVQPGDTPETMLRRADRALLQAKQRGRNMVVQLGSGITEPEEPAKGGFSWFRRPGSGDLLVQKRLTTTVPLKMAVEKIRGFVADHHAEIESIDGQNITLKLSAGWGGFLKRRSDRPAAFVIELRLTEERADAGAAGRDARQSRTQVHLLIRPMRSRDRRRGDLAVAARQLASSVKSYLMAIDEEEVVAEAPSSRPMGTRPSMGRPD
ncbi:MAG TPA: diguanylate cyclase [Pirellulales bacterium]|nr:diguanylate cyclase [Pirellulales bacterium]